MIGRSRFGPRPTGVGCPACADGELAVGFSCRATRVACRACGRRFELGELSRILDEAAFERLAEAVGDRLSDRV